MEVAFMISNLEIRSVHYNGAKNYYEVLPVLALRLDKQNA